MAENMDTSADLAKQLQTLRERVAHLESVEVRYSNLFEHAGDAIFVIELKTHKILDANAAAARRLGYSGDELKQLTLSDLEVVAEDNDASNEESLFSRTKVYECEYRHKEGYLIPVLVTSRVILMGDGGVLQKSVHDISRRKQSEDKLREAHDRLLVLQSVDEELADKLDYNYVLNIALDAAMRLSAANTGIIGMVEGDELKLVRKLGRYPREIGSRLSMENGIIGRVVRRREAELITDVSADPDYIGLVVETTAQMTLPIISHQRLIGVLGLETRHPTYFTQENFEFLKLLTARIATALDNARAYEELGHMVEELDAFAHTVAHDLKNPISIIQGYAELWQDNLENTPPDEAQMFLDAIVRGSKKMTSIINELLLLASVRKLEEIKTTPLNMEQIVSEALARLTMMVDQYNPQIVRPKAEEWPTARGYAPWVEEVWANYISNALKYGGSPPQIELGATALQADGVIRFWVRDNGPGIPPEEQTQLFNQFTRLDETRAQGHGLGLSIIQRIVRKLGGEVGVESESGKGSVFTFTLPIAN